ncbi:MAG: NAD-dependent epimerase/dehydratase family protein [Bacteroidetes bacterium]|nr:NAD-dependent epimerase/dehydratase family protein [Bacteroidota bacterium]
MRILIVGSEGFIGSNLTHYFTSNGNDVYGCDLFETSRHAGYTYHKVSRLSSEWDDIFSSINFDYCINAAGSGNVPYSMNHPFIDFEANTLDAIRVLDAMRRHNSYIKYIHISSAAVYGTPLKLPVDEESVTAPLSPYGWHKLMAENICKEYHTVYRLPIAVIRPFSVYGNGLCKQLFWDVCEKLFDQDEIELFGTGNESRDFLHVTDLARLTQCIIANDDFKCNTFNGGTGIETSIARVAEIFQKYYGAGKKILFNGNSRTGDPRNWRADTKKISAIGFKPSTELEEGIQSYIAWYKATQQ